MLCDNCHKRRASIHLYTNVNGQDREISLCQQCYQELKNQQGQNNSMNNNNNISMTSPFANIQNNNNNNTINNDKGYSNNTGYENNFIENTNKKHIHYGI